MRINTSDIVRRPELQLRDALDPERIAAMTEFLEQGGVLPPVTIVGEENLLADGHHRVYVAERAGRTNVEANREDGGEAEAIAIALNRNDTAQSQPLTRTQRNAGIKRLLDAGWTQRRIASVTGITHRTVGNIAQTRAVRATLSTETNDALNDTAVARIAVLPEEQRVEFADAAAAVSLSEPRIREAIQTLRANPEMTPTQAVAAHTPRTLIRQTPISDVATNARRKLQAFLAETMTVDGVEYDFWKVLDVFIVHLRDNAMAGDLQANGLADLLAEVSVLSDKYASLLRSGTSEDEQPTALVQARN